VISRLPACLPVLGNQSALSGPNAAGSECSGGVLWQQLCGKQSTQAAVQQDHSCCFTALRSLPLPMHI
jgi:hypothetical protein